MLTDDAWRRRFAELREADERITPPFHRVWSHALARAQRPVRRVGRHLGLAAALLLLMVVVIMRERRAPRVDIAAWRSPTEFLLQSLPPLGVPHFGTNP